MREIDEIQTDWYLANSSADLLAITEAEERLIQDVPDLLAELAEKDAEILRMAGEIVVMGTGELELVNASLELAGKRLEDRAEIEELTKALNLAVELFEDECTLSKRDSFVWLFQAQELLGR
ncbi:MAG TPA: hypothetical protein VM537_36285 [Anaerolineae bacterium]|nr:hypothetical protein [Anaerolineae bacterium]